MTKIEQNPLVAINNAREQGRQLAERLMLDQGPICPACLKPRHVGHPCGTLSLGTGVVWDGPPPPMTPEVCIPAPVVRPLVEHLTERHAELKRLCWKLLDDMCNAYPEKSRTYWHSPNHQAIADFLHFK